MLIGHVAIGLAGKKFAPKTAVGTSIFAATLIDILAAVLVVLGIEKSRVVEGITEVYPLDLDIPWSHSLVSALLLSLAAGGVYYLATRYRRGAVWLMLAVMSHWVLDVITHIPDMPLWPGGAKIGLGLWMSLPATVAVEGSLFAACLFLYWRATRSRSIGGHIALWLSVFLMVCVYIASFTMPQPASPDMRGYQMLFLAILVPVLGYWMDRTRLTIDADKSVHPDES